MHSLSLNGGSGLANLVADEETKKLLECPVCIDIALPPIYNCRTGHIICHQCKKKLRLCVLCKSPYTNSRNFQLESLVQSAQFYCQHRHQSCNVTGNTVELKKHHQQCPLRLTKCHLAPIDDCAAAELYLSDYIRHLEECHKLDYVQPGDQPNRFTLSYHLANSNDNLLKDSFTWVSSLLKFEDQVFLDLIRNRGPILHFGLFLVGTTEVAGKYSVKITVQKTTEIRVNKFEITTPVLSIRDFQEEAKNDKNEVLPYSAILHKKFLDIVGEVTSDEEGSRTSKLEWSVVYEIIKII